VRIFLLASRNNVAYFEVVNLTRTGNWKEGERIAKTVKFCSRSAVSHSGPDRRRAGNSLFSFLSFFLYEVGSPARSLPTFFFAAG